MSDPQERSPLPRTIVPGELFVRLNTSLIELLRSLEPHEWDQPTICKGWSVKDLAAHILDGMLRRLSMHRDGYHAARTLQRCGPPSDLVTFVSRLNQSWTEAADRWSPRVLIDLLEWAEPQCAMFFDSLPVDDEALFPVSWAGEEVSQNWLDVARDFTERWNHHRQIAEAVGRGIEAVERPEYRLPVFNTYARAFPAALAGVDRPEGTVVRVVVDEPVGLVWDVVRSDGPWSLYEPAGEAQTIVEVPSDAAWLVFTKRWTPETFRKQFPMIRIAGDEQLGDCVLRAVAMVA